MSDDYAPYDPTEVIPSALAAEPDDTPAEPVSPEELPQFDPRVAEAFTGLVFIGALTRPFSFFGHRIVIRTLKNNELLAAGLLAAPYTGTVGEFKAFVQATMCLALVSVDGKELPVLPLGDGPDQMSQAQARFTWVGDQYHPTVIAAMYEQYLVLDNAVQQVVDAMGKASAQPG